MEPQYTEEARVAKYQGTVVLAVEIGSDGFARNIHVVRGLGLGLDENAVTAVSQWTFEPGKKDGGPVTVQATIEVNFRLLYAHALLRAAFALMRTQGSYSQTYK